MRCDNISLTLSIPVKINESDGNGVIYTENAIKNACDNANNTPFIIYNSEGEPVPVGVVTHVEYFDSFITAEVDVWHGGTENLVNEIIDKKVTSMEIVGLGICE